MWKESPREIQGLQEETMTDAGKVGTIVTTEEAMTEEEAILVEATAIAATTEGDLATNQSHK